MRYFVFIGIILSVFALSCRDQIYYTGDDVNCFECYVDYPETGYLVIDFTLDDENTQIPITVFSGKVDQSPVVYHAVCDTTPLYLEVPMNGYYSVKAAYKHGNDSVYAIDNGKFEAKLVVGLCDEDCWVITGGEYKVELVY